MIITPNGEKFISHWESSPSLKTGHVNLPHGLTLGKLKQSLHYFRDSIFFPFELMTRHALTYPQAVEVIRALEAMKIFLVDSHPMNKESLNRVQWSGAQEIMASYPDSFTPLRISKKGAFIGLGRNSTPKPLTAKKLEALLGEIENSIAEAGLIHCLGSLSICCSQDIYLADTHDLYIACSRGEQPCYKNDMEAAFFLAQTAFRKLRGCEPGSLRNVMPKDCLGAVYLVHLNRDNADAQWQITKGGLGVEEAYSWIDVYHDSSRRPVMFDLSNSMVHFEETPNLIRLRHPFPVLAKPNKPIETAASIERVRDLFERYIDLDDDNETIMAACDELVCSLKKPLSPEEQKKFLRACFPCSLNYPLGFLEGAGYDTQYGSMTGLSSAWQQLCALRNEKNKNKPVKKTPEPIYYTVVNMCLLEPQLGAVVRCPPSQMKPLYDVMGILGSACRDLVSEGFKGAGIRTSLTSQDLVFFRVSTPGEELLFNSLVTKKTQKGILFTPKEALAISGGNDATSLNIRIQRPELELIESPENLLRHYFCDTGFDSLDIDGMPEKIRRRLAPLVSNNIRGNGVLLPDSINFFTFNLTPYLRSGYGCEWQRDEQSDELIRLRHVRSSFSLAYRRDGVTGRFDGKKVFELSHPRFCHLLILEDAERVLNRNKINAAINFDEVYELFAKHHSLSNDSEKRYELLNPNDYWSFM